MCIYVCVHLLNTKMFIDQFEFLAIFASKWLLRREESRLGASSKFKLKIFEPVLEEH